MAQSPPRWQQMIREGTSGVKRYRTLLATGAAYVAPTERMTSLQYSDPPTSPSSHEKPVRLSETRSRSRGARALACRGIDDIPAAVLQDP